MDGHAEADCMETHACLVLGSAPCLQFVQQLLDAIFFFERAQPVFQIVGCDFRLRFTLSFGVGNFPLHAIKCVRGRSVP